MTFWEKITGNDMTKELQTFESRAQKLPKDYQAAWEKIKVEVELYMEENPCAPW